jgi:hypothetical protein
MHLELQFCSPFVGAGQPLNVQVCKSPHDAQEDSDSWHSRFDRYSVFELRDSRRLATTSLR